ncbi:MAG: tryptophan synthase subunit alpha [Nitrososphaeraceae archaeon]
MAIDLRNNRLTKKFQELSKRNQHALICYVVAGYPDVTTTENIISCLVSAGADIIEIGIPFSDPIADGPIIQEASYDALLNGITPEKCWNVFRRIRSKFPDLPILIMTYSNILLKAGFENFMMKSKQSGIDGFILPDMTIEESNCYIKQASRLGLATIFLASPNTSNERLNAIMNRSSGFVYLVSIYGTTGTRKSIEDYTLRAIRNTKRIAGSRLPVAVGFGITKPSHVRFMIEAGADAVIVGSAIVNKIKSSNNRNGKREMLNRLGSYITQMKRACK